MPVKDKLSREFVSRLIPVLRALLAVKEYSSKPTSDYPFYWPSETLGTALKRSVASLQKTAWYLDPTKSPTRVRTHLLVFREICDQVSKSSVLLLISPKDLQSSLSAGVRIIELLTGKRYRDFDEPTSPNPKEQNADSRHVRDEDTAANRSDGNPVQSEVKSLPQRAKLAYLSHKYAESKIHQPPKTDRDAYDWLYENAGADDYKLPNYNTWVRYLRAGRKYYGTQKNSPRGGRRTGKSIIPANQIDTPRQEDQ